MLPKEKYYQITAEKLIERFAKRGIEGYYCPTGEQAVDKVFELIDEGASVSWGGSMTLKELGLHEKIKNGDYVVYDRAEANNNKEKEEIYHKALNSDFYLMSSNAITLGGKLVNIDGNGNRIAALIYGPKNVIVVAGMNKVTTDEESAMKRIRNYASPVNALRLSQNTPCAATGECHDCLSDACICCQVLVTRKSRTKNRIKVILVGEELSY